MNDRPQATTAPDDRGSRVLLWPALAVVLAVVLRWSLLDVPLERDEGEYAYGGWLILRGVPPFEGLYNMKLPGIYAAYAAVLAVFGESPRGIHLGLLVVNAVAAVLVFLLGRRVRGTLAGAVAAFTFVVLSASPSVQGVFANAEHFVLPFALAGLWFLLRGNGALRRRDLVIGGLLLGTAVLMKQHGAAFAVVGGVVVLFREGRRRDGGLRAALTAGAVLVLAVLVPYLVTCLVMQWCGVFDTFWRWTIEYARAYTGQLRGMDAWRKFVQRFGEVVGGTPWPWLLVPLGGVALGVDRRVRRALPFLIAFFVLSFAAICPGFFFRPHYWVLLLPAASVTAGLGVAWLRDALATQLPTGRAAWIAVGVAAVCLVAALLQHARFWFVMTPREASRAVYATNPFPESEDVARYLRDHTGADDRIAVLGSEPQIYFLAGRRSATGHIYTYGLMEIQPYAGAMADEMIAEIEAAAPQYLVYVNLPLSWLQRPDSDRRLFDWFDRYRTAYELVAMSVVGKERSRFLEQEQMRELQRQGKELPREALYVWRRRE